MQVTGADGEVRVLGAGDTAHFPAGTSFVWEVPEYVRKLAIHRAASTLPDRAVLKGTRALAGRRSALGIRLLLIPHIQPDLVLACLSSLPA